VKKESDLYLFDSSCSKSEFFLRCAVFVNNRTMDKKEVCEGCMIFANIHTNEKT